MLRIKSFAINFSEVESAIFLHKINDGIELLIYETRIVRDQCDGNDSRCFIVIMVNFRYGDIESALQSADYTLDDTSLFLK